MLRISNNNDINRIIELLDFELKEYEKEKLCNDWDNKKNSKFVYEENNNIYGFVLGTSSGEITIYVSENYRNKGIGEVLYSKIIYCFNINNISNSIVEIRIEKNYTGDFFLKRGYRKWFGYQKMKYNGEFMKSNLQLVNYSNCYYDEYKRVYEQCFFEMRRSLDLQPYNCCDTSDELNRKENEIFLLLNNKELIASVSCLNNEIDDLIVNKKYQRQGYGKKILKFAINRMQSNGIEDIVLGVAHWNSNAIRLYEDNNFLCKLSCEVYKK